MATYLPTPPATPPATTQVTQARNAIYEQSLTKRSISASSETTDELTTHTNRQKIQKNQEAKEGVLQERIDDENKNFTSLKLAVLQGYTPASDLHYTAQQAQAIHQHARHGRKHILEEMAKAKKKLEEEKTEAIKLLEDAEQAELYLDALKQSLQQVKEGDDGYDEIMKNVEEEIHKAATATNMHEKSLKEQDKILDQMKTHLDMAEKMREAEIDFVTNWTTKQQARTNYREPGASSASESENDAAKDEEMPESEVTQHHPPAPSIIGHIQTDIHTL